MGHWFAGSSFFAHRSNDPPSAVVVNEGATCVMAGTANASRTVGPVNMLTIPAGRYELPAANSPLHPFLPSHRLSEIVLPEPVLIQEQAVSIALFKQYVDAVEQMPSGEEKEEKLAHIGMFWNKKESVSPAVRGVSLEAAMDFSRWLAQQTHCHFQIPSREEWAAAIIHLFQSGVPLPKPSDGFDATPLKSLLQGGNEWTRSPCPVGYYLVGEEDWGAGMRDGQPSCIPNLFSVAGFRMVIHPARASTAAADTDEAKSNH